MSVDQWYVPGSLRSAGSEAIHFSFRWRSLRLMLYVAHEVVLLVDAARATKVQISYRGRTVAAEDLVKTNWVVLEGENLDVRAELPNGLKPGVHRVEMTALLGGDFMGGVSGKPVRLCAFTTEVKLVSTKAEHQ